MNSCATDRMSQWWLRPLGWPSHLLSGVAAALALWGAIPPGGYIEVWIFSAVLWLAVGLIWGGRALARLTVAKVHQQPFETLPGGWKSWRVVPTLLLGTSMMLFLHIPFYVAFFLSRPAMEQFSRQVLTSPSSVSQQPQRVGLYWTGGFHVTSWGMRFYLFSGWPDSYGFAYSSRGTPPPERTDNLGLNTYTPIMGNWYEWKHTEDW